MPRRISKSNLELGPNITLVQAVHLASAAGFAQAANKMLLEHLTGNKSNLVAVRNCLYDAFIAVDQVMLNKGKKSSPDKPKS